jgi:hypothetical protein
MGQVIVDPTQHNNTNNCYHSFKPDSGIDPEKYPNHGLGGSNRIDRVNLMIKVIMNIVLKPIG